MLGAADHDEPVSGCAARDEFLFAIDQVAVALAADHRGQASHVRARARFAECKCRLDLPSAQAGQQLARNRARIR
jgi:hypothetical protein